MPDDHSDLVPPLPIPNRTVKRICAVDLQKHIFGGKVLIDSQRLGDLPGIKDTTKFVSVMLSKKKVVPENSAVSDAKPLVVEKDKNSKAKESKEISLDVPQQYLQQVDDLVAMGYPRDEAIRALKRAFYSSERAVEYLTEGVPQNVKEENMDADTVDGDSEGEGDAAEGGAIDFEQLRNDPNFQAIAIMIRSNPSSLQSVLAAIATSNPELHAAASANPAAFIGLINSIPAAGAPTNSTNAPNVVANMIPTTAEDRAAIDRLIAMGFPRMLVIEAYFACDKNEELAINYIINNMQDFNGQFNN